MTMVAKAAMPGVEVALIEQLLGPDAVAEAQRARRRRTRLAGLRIAAAVVVIAVLVLIGLAATSDPGGRTLQGRTGPVHTR